VNTKVEHRPEQSRYELLLNGELAGVADYHAVGDVLVFPHTQIATRLRGRGLGAVLIGGALDDVRERGATVVPRCWYVAQFIDENPAYKDLLAA
jgi:uncharacterized protein